MAGRGMDDEEVGSLGEEGFVSRPGCGFVDEFEEGGCDETGACEEDW